MHHILLKNEQERWLLCWRYLQFKFRIDAEVWREEDIPLLTPFFKYSDQGSDRSLMTEEEKASFEHYKKCMKEYARDLFDTRDSVEHYHMDHILEAFGYEYDENENDDKNEEILNSFSETNNPAKNKLELEYPVIAVVWIESDFDRFGANGILCVDFVEQKEFNPKNPEKS